MDSDSAKCPKPEKSLFRMLAPKFWGPVRPDSYQTPKLGLSWEPITTGHYDRFCRKKVTPHRWTEVIFPEAYLSVTVAPLPGSDIFEHAVEVFFDNNACIKSITRLKFKRY